MKYNAKLARSALVCMAFCLIGNPAFALPPDAAIEFDGHYYLKLFPKPALTWDAAQEIAAALSMTLDDGTVLKGHLVTINSQAEQDFVSTTFLTANFQQLWLGGYQYSESGSDSDNWAWVTGEEDGNLFTDWTFEFMQPPEPSGGALEQVLRMLINNGSGVPPGTLQDRWHDFPHDNLNVTVAVLVEFDEIGDHFVSLDQPPRFDVGISIGIVNLKGSSSVRVAILTDNDFDALQVDPTTVEFGPDGANPIRHRVKVKDFDHDGDADLILRFRSRETGIQCADEEATLIGTTHVGDNFSGMDSIRTVGCRH